MGIFNRNKISTSNTAFLNSTPSEPVLKKENKANLAELKESRINRATEYLKIFQKRLVGNSATSNIFFTDINAKSDEIFQLKNLVSPDNQPILFSLFGERTVEFNPKIHGSLPTMETLKKIFDLNSVFRKESGFDATYIGWPFVCGSTTKEIIKAETKQETEANARLYSFCGPLLLWKVKINVDLVTGIENISLVLNDEGKPIIELNSEIIVRGLVQHKINVTSQLSTTVNFDHENFEKMIKDILAAYASAGYSILNDDVSNLLNIIENLQVSEYVPKVFNMETDSKNNSDFMIFDAGVLAILPPSTASGSLYFDYSKMLATDGPQFFSDLHHSICDTLKLSKEAGKNFSEAEVKEIIPLDYPQKKAARMALNNSLVVQGPPGTGKSQTISNIIANYINLCRSVLFVTEKKTAAGVVYNRLNRLRGYCLKFYEVDADANEFTRQIRLGLDRIRELYGISALNDESSSSIVASSRLDEIFDKLDKFKSAMKNEQGKKFPQFVKKYIDQKDNLHAGLEYVKSIVQTFNTAKDFWNFIKRTVDDSNFFTTIKGVEKSLELNDTQMAMLMDLVSVYDGNPESVIKSIPYYLKYNEVVADVEEMAHEVHEHHYLKNENYNSLVNAVGKLDEFSIFAISAKSKDWYQKFSVFTTQELYKNILTFNSKFDAEKFDFDLAHNLNKVITFLNQNASNILIDNENFFEEIDDLVSQKQAEDLISCETNFIRNLIKTLDSNPVLYRQFNELYAFINSVEVVKNIKLILAKYSDVLSLCFPVIISSPHAASMLLPSQWGLFDHVVIDEASQLSIEKAIPILYRGKRFCVLGDKKQTPPTDILNNVKFDYDKSKMKTIEDKLEWELLNEAKSLIEYALQKVQVTTLNYHYRSQKKELINFSNNVFYSGTLNVCDAPIKNGKGLTLINTRGRNVNGINKAESDAIIAEIEKICDQPNHGSVGVITITKEQAYFIKSQLYLSKNQNVLNELVKVDSSTGEDISLFVKTIEDVQGEERDNIFISCSWSLDESHTKLSNGFGYLEEKYGANRVNVAASRSKYSMCVVKSFNAMDIDTDNYGALIFKKFLTYVELLDKIKDINSPEIANMFVEYTKDVITLQGDVSSKGENWLSREIGEQLEPLLPNGFKCIYTRHEGSFKIGICIQKLSDGSYPLGIICDEFTFDPTIAGKERDFYQQKFLELKGWKFFRVSALQWCRKANQEIIVMNILRMLKYVLDITAPEYLANPNKHKIKLEQEKLPATFGFFEQDETDKQKQALKALGLEEGDLEGLENADEIKESLGDIITPKNDATQISKPDFSAFETPTAQPDKTAKSKAKPTKKTTATKKPASTKKVSKPKTVKKPTKPAKKTPTKPKATPKKNIKKVSKGGKK